MSHPRLFFIRHAQTSANTGMVWHGTTDTDLSEHGHDQVALLAESFRELVEPDAIYTSPLTRTRLTAEGVAKKFDLNPIHDPRLMELSMGDWEGVTYQDLHTNHDAFRNLQSNTEYRAPGGESSRDVATRTIDVIEEISKAHPAGNVVIVSHGLAIAMTFAKLLHDDLTRWGEYVSNNTSVSELCLKKKELVFFNRTDHLGRTP